MRLRNLLDRLRSGNKITAANNRYDQILMEINTIKMTQEKSDSENQKSIHKYFAYLIDRIYDVEKKIDESIAKEGYGTQEQALAVVSLLRPYKCSNKKKSRFGKIGDGGYVHIDDFASITTAISLGIANEVSWDLEMASRGIKVYQYDNSVDGPPQQSSNFHFERSTIGCVAENGVQTLDDIIEKNKIDPNATIMKIDIEGDEWDVLACIREDVLAQFSQIVCEFHGIATPTFLRNFSRRLDCLSKLNRHFGVVHIHANNYARVRLIGSIAIPEVIEVTYANRLKFELSESDEVFPTNLDSPNDPARPEIMLGKFTY